MTFAQIRAQFITLSGRADFTDSAGDGCEFFIKAGHKLLERMVSSPRAIIEDEVDTVASRRWVLSDSYRAIKEVWVKDSTQGDVPWVKLDRITYSDYLNAYNSDTDTNIPKYWTLYTDDKQDQTYEDKSGIILFPTPDAVYNLRILGIQSENFNGYSESGKTWWSTQWPELVIYASLYTLETFYRNTEGANDWMNALKTFTKEVDFDNVEQELAEVNAMRDSYSLNRDWKNYNNLTVK